VELDEYQPVAAGASLSPFAEMLVSSVEQTVAACVAAALDAAEAAAVGVVQLSKEDRTECFEWGGSEQLEEQPHDRLTDQEPGGVAGMDSSLEPSGSSSGHVLSFLTTT